MTNEEYGLGLLLSPKDSRDFQYKDILPDVVKSVRIPSEYVSPYLKNIPSDFITNQYNYGMCVSFQLAYERFLTEYKQNKDTNKYSEAWVYGYREPDDYQGDGMYPREALKNAQKYGIPYKKDLSIIGDYDTCKQEVEKVKETLKDEAYKHRISGYFAVDTDNIEEIKECILNFGYCFVSIRVYNTFSTDIKNGIIANPADNDTLRGSHMVGLYGWDRYGHWLMLNSWGVNWGNNGVALLPCTYELQEAYGILDSITNNEELQPYFFVVSNNSFSTKESAMNYLKTMERFAFVKFKELQYLPIYKINEKYYFVYCIEKEYEVAKSKCTDYFELKTFYKNETYKVIVNIEDSDLSTIEFIYDGIKEISSEAVIEKLDNLYYVKLGDFENKTLAENYIKNYIDTNNEGDYLEIKVI